MASVSNKMEMGSSGDDWGKDIQLDNIPQAIRPAPTLESSEGYIHVPEKTHFDTAIKTHAAAIFQIENTKTGSKGTGCLIGGNLLMTNNHVIASREIAEDCRARLWYITEISPNREDYSVYFSKPFKFKPEGFFAHSPDHKGIPQPADANHLDYTILELEHSLVLAKLQSACLSIIFDQPSLAKNHLVCVIQHPNIVDEATGLAGPLKTAAGSIRQIGEFTLHHDAQATKGSSGGAIIDMQGRLIALHHQGEPSPDSKSRSYGYGVLTSAIAIDLDSKGKMTTLKNHIRESSLVLTKLKPKDPPNPLHEIRRPPPHFTGRTNDLEKLHKSCSEGRRVAITGLGGMGKTALALQYVNQYADKFTFVRLLNGRHLNESLIEFTKDLKIPKQTEISRLYRQIRKKLDHEYTGFLLVIDNIDQKELIDILEACLPREDRAIIITSRLTEPLYPLECEPLPIQALPKEEAAAFLVAATGKPKTEETDTIAKLLHYFPLALTHAAGYIRTREKSYKDYLALLQTSLGTLKKPLSCVQDTIFTTWQVTLDAIQQKQPLAMDVMQLISHLAPSSISRDLLYELVRSFGKDMESLDDALARLSEYSMIDLREADLSVHPLVQYVLSQSSPYRKHCIEEIYKYFKKFDYNNMGSWKYARQAAPHAICLLDENAEDKSAARMFWHLGIYHYLIIGNYHQALFYYQKVLTTYIKVYKGEDYTDVAKTLYCIGNVFADQGKLEAALEHYNRTLDIYTKAYNDEDHTDVAKTLHCIGSVLAGQGKLEAALEHYKRALAIKTKAYNGEDHTSVAATLHAIGFVLADQGKLEEALEHYKRALAIKTTAYKGEDHASVAVTLHGIGNVLAGQGKFEEALEHYNRSLAIKITAYKGENHTDVATTLHCIGNMLADQDKHEEALEHFNRALAIKTKAYKGEDHTAVAKTLHGIGCVLAGQGKLEAALEHFDRVLVIYTKAYNGEDHTDVAKTLHCIGNMLADQDKHEEALEHFNRALAIKTKAYNGEDHTSVATTLHQIGNVLADQGKLEAALEHYKRALAIRTKAYNGEDHTSVATTLHCIGTVLYRQGKLEEALEHFNRALAIYTKAYNGEDHTAVATTLHAIGNVLEHQEHHEEAFAKYKQALKIYKKLFPKGHPDMQLIIDAIERVKQSES